MWWVKMQVLSNISATEFESGPAQEVFASTVCSFLSSCSGILVDILSISVVEDESFSAEVRTVNRWTVAIENTDDDIRSIMVDYSLSFTITADVAAEVYASAKTNLTTAVTSGQFTAVMTSKAHSANVTVLLHAEVAPSIVVSQPSVVRKYPDPSTMPTSSPTMAPTILPSLVVPKISSLVLIADATYVTATVRLTSAVNNPGVVFCSAYTAAISDIGGLKFSSYFTTYITTASEVNVRVQGLLPLASYTCYCAVQTSYNQWSSISDVKSSGKAFMTSCCFTISVKAPFQVYANKTGDISNIFSYSLQAAPRKSLSVRPILSHVNGSRISSAVLTLVPNAGTLFLSSTGTRLTGQFIISGQGWFTGDVLVGLDVTGMSSADYYPTSSYIVNILSSIQLADAPILVSAMFSDSGAWILVQFDKATNMAGLPNSYWNCNRLFQTNVATSGCLWLNGSYVQMFSSYLDLNDQVTLLDNKLKVYCSTGLNSCPYDYYSFEQTVGISRPSQPLVPTIIIKTAPATSTCDNVHLDASASYGSGGRNWIQAYWDVSCTGCSDDFDARVSEYLYNVSDISRVIVIPKGILAAGTYAFTLTLENFLQSTARSQVVIDIKEGGNIPKLTILGSQQLQLYSSSMLSVVGNGALSSCAPSSARLVYLWGLSENGSLLRINSTSVSSLTYSLAPYSLQHGTSYTLLFTAYSVVNSKEIGSASAATTIYIETAPVFAVISGECTVHLLCLAVVTLCVRRWLSDCAIDAAT
jgi:hypothetical protein